MNRRSFIAFLVAAPISRKLPWNSVARIVAPLTPVVSAEITKSLADIITEMIRSRSAEIAANVVANNALLHKLKQGGAVKPFTGGVPL